MNSKTSLPIEERVIFNRVRYANCWEDADILIEALSNKTASRFLSIASAGDNSLALLALKPELVVATDLSLAQLACLEIRQVAFAELDYADLTGFLGFRSCQYDRNEVYRALRPSLSLYARCFWDQRSDSLSFGLIHDGKFERYLRFFGRHVLPLIHSRNILEGIRQKRDEHERHSFYNVLWNNWRWRLLFRLFFSRLVMGHSGRDPEFMRYVEGNVANRILSRAQFGLTHLATHNNPYLDYILTNHFQDSLPFYAREENYHAIKTHLNKLKLFHGSTNKALQAFKTGFDGFNMSDIFEYMSPHLFKATAEQLLDHANDGARIAYWNMLVPRQIARVLPGRVHCMEQQSAALFQKDKAFFYQAFYLDEVTK